MIIRDISYNVSDIRYSVHYKNRKYKRVVIQCLTLECFKVIVIFHNHRNIPLYKKIYKKKKYKELTQSKIAFLKYLATIRKD